VFVLPSLEEGSGSVSLLEAMQAGAAPVVSRIDGIPKDVVDGESALLVPPGNPVAVAAALERILGDGELRRRISLAARGRYLARFSPAIFSADLQRIYAGLGFHPT
jgi:glycosyltransferase involved in cell wall biosynthesis